MSDNPLSPDIKFQLVRKIECHKVIGLAGLELLAHESKYMEFHRLAGVVFFERNIESLSDWQKCGCATRSGELIAVHLFSEIPM